MPPSTRYILISLACACLSVRAHVIENEVLFCVSLPEQHVFNSLGTINAATGTTINSVILVVSILDGNVIYYDHWEDCYKVKIANPVQSSTQAWGDNDASNGIPPGYALDLVDACDVIALENTLVFPRNPATVVFDGRDKFGVTKPTMATRSAWATTPGSVLAGAVELYPRRRFGTVYEAPVGEDVKSSDMFEYSAMLIMAGFVGTTVQIDIDADAVVDVTVVLNKGKAYQVDGGVNVGATIAD
jgi:hypothetical protein